LSSRFVATAVLVYAIAAVRAVGVLRPHDYRGPTVGDLRVIAETHWAGTTAEALRATYEAMLEMLTKAKSSNKRKAEELDDAILFEVGATAVLAAGAVLVLLGL
jgi:hypothetical protein